MSKLMDRLPGKIRVGRGSANENLRMQNLRLKKALQQIRFSANKQSLTDSEKLDSIRGILNPQFSSAPDSE